MLASVGTVLIPVLISPPPGPPATMRKPSKSFPNGFDLAPTGATCYIAGADAVVDVEVLISPPPGPPATADQFLLGTADKF